MSETVRITVAPRCFVTISPHPSGVAALRSLTLGPGNTADVSRARATDLYRAGLILDPVSGALPPTPEPMLAIGTTITIGDAPARLANGGMIQVEAASEALVMPSSPVEPRPQTNHEHGLMPRPSVIFNGGQVDQIASITTADGRVWPSY